MHVNGGNRDINPQDIEISPYDTAEYLDNDAIIAGYLAISLDDPDPRIFYQALWDVMRAKGIASIAKETGLTREALYRMCQRGKKPQFETIMRITRAIGVPLGFPTVTGSGRSGKASRGRRREKAR